MPEIVIAREDGETKARYIARVAGQDAVGELTLSKLSDTTIIADHTAVPEALRGQGVARALVERLVDDARVAGQTIVPLCPYVRALAQKQAQEWADVINM